MGSIDDSGHYAAYPDYHSEFSIFESRPHETYPSSITSGPEILLLSWLLVLLRTQEERCASFEWSYRISQDGVERQVPAIRLSSDEVMTESQLQTTFSQAVEAVARHIKANAPALRAISPKGASILVSTASLSHKTDDNDQEVRTQSSLAF